MLRDKRGRCVFSNHKEFSLNGLFGRYNTWFDLASYVALSDAISIPCKHETSEELRQTIMIAQRQDVGDVLVRSYDHDTASAIDIPSIKDIPMSIHIFSTEDLFVISESILSLLRPHDSRHVVDIQGSMALLQNTSDIDDGVDISTSRVDLVDKLGQGFAGQVEA